MDEFFERAEFVATRDDAAAFLAADDVDAVVVVTVATETSAWTNHLDRKWPSRSKKSSVRKDAIVVMVVAAAAVTALVDNEVLDGCKEVVGKSRRVKTIT